MLGSIRISIWSLISNNVTNGTFRSSPVCSTNEGVTASTFYESLKRYSVTWNLETVKVHSNILCIIKLNSVLSDAFFTVRTLANSTQSSHIELVSKLGNYVSFYESFGSIHVAITS